MDYQDNGRNENTSQNRANTILDAIDALIGVAQSDSGDGEATTGEADQSPLKQLQSEMTRQGALIEKQLRQREILNSRMDYLADKVAQLQGAKHMNADNPDFQDCAHLASGDGY